MRRTSSTGGLLVPLFLWSSLWWVVGKPQMVLAGVVFAALLVPLGMLRSRLAEPEWATIRNLATAGGFVLALCCAVLIGGWNSVSRVGNPLAGELDPLTYDGFEVVGQIVTWDILPARPEEYEGWDPLLVTVTDDQNSFEFICDGSEVRDRLEKGRTLKASGEFEGRTSLSSTPMASWVEILD